MEEGSVATMKAGTLPSKEGSLHGRRLATKWHVRVKKEDRDSLSKRVFLLPFFRLCLLSVIWNMDI